MVTKNTHINKDVYNSTSFIWITFLIALRTYLVETIYAVSYKNSSD